ncbi:MAG: glycosyltransferase [Bacteroidota bacterium]
MSNGIVIPCYNESSHLDVKSFIEYAANNKHNILCFVNDGSSDETRETLAKIKSVEHENVHIYNMDKNSGKAKAVQQGALYLYYQTSVQTIGFIDAHLSPDFEDYADLLWAMKINKNLKAIYGSRTSNKIHGVKRNGIRNIISFIVRIVIYCITGLKIQQIQHGAKVFDRKLIPALFGQEFKSRWLFDIEILLRLKKKLTIKRFRQLFVEKTLTRSACTNNSRFRMKDALSLVKIGWIYNIYRPLKKFTIIPFGICLRLSLRVTVLKVMAWALMICSLTLVFFIENVMLKYLLISLNGLTVAILLSSVRKILKPKLDYNLKWLWMQAWLKKIFRSRKTLKFLI